MAKMLRASSTSYFGCCDHCARRQKPNRKPGPRERHQARAIEKRKAKREIDQQRL